MAKKESVEKTKDKEPEVDTTPVETSPEVKAKMAGFHERTQDELRINDTDLQSEFQSQAPAFYMAAARFVKASQVYDREKNKLEEVIADKYMEMKGGVEKTTEAYLEKASKYCSEARAQRQRVIDAEYQMNYYKTIQDAWVHKKDMLIQMGANARAEYTGQVGINKTHPEHDDVPRVKNGRPTSL